MPSASTKVDKQGKVSNGHVNDYIQQIVSMMEKKIRTLEKKKGKLETYKANLSNGKECDGPQMAAIAKYDEVVHHLDISKELLKQFSSISQEAIMANKKQTKKNQTDRHEQELRRLRELLTIQDVLSGLGDEGARDDFLNGQNGAITLTKANLEALDALYKLITPTREVENDGPTYEEQLVVASEHFSCLLDGKPKKIVGTCYKDLHKMIISIHECGYFNQIQNVVAEEPVIDVANGEENVCSEIESTFESIATEVPPVEVNEYVAVLTETQPIVPQPAEIVSNRQPTIVDEIHVVNKSVEDKTVFSTFDQDGPYTDIISNGCFNFLQDSEIELSATHLDPAVVAIHNSVPSSVIPYLGVQCADGLQYSFQLGSEDPLLSGNSSVGNPLHQVNQFVAQSQMVSHSGATDFRSSIPSQTFTNQTFDLQSFTEAVYGQVPPQTVIQSAPLLDRPIVSEPKKHLMNVNATTFESLSYKQLNSVAMHEESQSLQQQQQQQQHTTLDDSLAHSALEQSLLQQQSDSLQFTSSLDTQENNVVTGYAHRHLQQSNSNQLDYNKLNYNNNRSSGGGGGAGSNRVSSVRNIGVGSGLGGNGVGPNGNGRSSMNGYTNRGPPRQNNNYSNGRNGGGGGGGNISNYPNHRDYRDYHHSYSRDSYDGTSSNHNVYSKRGGGGGGSMAPRSGLRGGGGNNRGPSTGSNGGPAHGTTRIGYSRPTTTSP